jgi:hypothetical protein
MSRTVTERTVTDEILAELDSLSEVTDKRDAHHVESCERFARVHAFLAAEGLGEVLTAL